MKKYWLLCFLLIGAAVHAQTSTNDVEKIVNDGIDFLKASLNDQAIEKFNEALKLDSTYADAYFEMANTLYGMRKKTDAIPYLQKLLKIDPKYTAGYDLLANIYDDMGETDLAIGMYKKGIKVNPDYQRLYHNMAICYYQMDKFAEAENYALEAIGLEPGYASSIRLYALATYKQHKRDRSLLAWCGFLMIENATARSYEANTYLKNILNYGIAKTGEKSVTVTVSDNDIGSGNMLMQMAVLTATDGKKNLSAIDSISLQLTEAFKVIAKTAKNKHLTGFNTYFAQYFGKLANTKNMPAFTHFITMGPKREENLTWFNEHPKEFDNLSKWINDNKVTF